ncbi:hypothetical protein RBH94_03255 [Aestuariibaculum sp. YM273]|uniref:hypothetical protein n=1 Tax=Aestuariibaculum sp. YM273 TaxID=3070659 RepID=UPI0027DC7F86|nr:hypothetical protein [Aestuariibaculum sp. YM273]WMI66183.1 hypothetical protein RBH94_03255 [Aestuariibaculum sp. YM273]
MPLRILFTLSICLLFFACSTGKLSVVADIPNNLKEVSGNEITTNSNLIWVIEDAGNRNNVYGLNDKGYIVKDIDVKNVNNLDWEDLTTDKEGNLYIGDIGNNDKNRKWLSILKISNPEAIEDETTAEVIKFKLPKGEKPKDFEAMFLFNNFFYLFSKESGKAILIKVPNIIGKHTAEILTEFNLNGKHNYITSADISEDGKTVVLLNHEKVWILTNFTDDNFFGGKLTKLPFEHDSQKEGVCFEDDNNILITDESNDDLGSNIYRFELKQKN